MESILNILVTLVIALIGSVFGYFMIARPDILLRWQTWSQKKFMGAEYIPGPRTYAITRVVGVIFVTFMLFVLITTVISFTSERESPISGPMETITICGDCQGRYGDLAIGMESNPQSGTYTLSSGEQLEGRIAKLWISVHDKSEENITMTVHVGQIFSVDKYKITVQYISGGTGSVELGIQEIFPIQ